MLRRTRAAHLTVTLTMLVVPASAFALTRTTASPPQTPDTRSSPLRLQSNPRQVRFGDMVDITGAAPAAAAGSRVVLETALSRAGTWKPIAETQVGPRGGFRFQVALRHSGLLRALPVGVLQSLARSGAAPVAGALTLAASLVRPVTVAARLRVAAMARAVVAGQSVTVTGRLAPEQNGRRVALQGLGAGGWQTLARTRTGRQGGFGLRWTPTLSQRLRVTFAGDQGNGRTSGSAGTVTVDEPSVASWYDDAGSTACGYHAGLGVANRTLPCGTQVQISYGGRTVTATVDDRGPYIAGRDWDLNQNTAGALGFSGVQTIWVTG